MIIDAHVIAWNEEEVIHLTVRHYKAFCRNVYIYDNFSIDLTRDIAEREGGIVRMFGIEGQLNDAEYLRVKNSCWKGSDADWVIVCDADEILYDPFLIESLMEAKESECSIVKPQGFNMFSNDVPRGSWIEIKTGIPDSNYSKLICFNPKALTEIGYVYGCHEARPQGAVKYYTGTPKLLHYKHVGGAQRIADRHALYASRLSPINKKWKLGYQYEEPREKTIKYFDDNLALAKPLW